MSHDSRVLVERAARGDGAAVEELLCAHLPALRAYVRLRAGPMLRAKESATDLAQSVCRDVLENLETFRFPGEGAFRAWLYATAARKIADRAEYWQAAKRDAPIASAHAPAGGDEGERELLGCYRSVCTPSVDAMGREAAERIEQAFAKLPEDQREVIVLARIVGLTRAEIAEQMGRSEAAIRNLLPRALARLAEHVVEVESP